jgi:integrase/recombinase XerD
MVIDYKYYLENTGNYKISSINSFLASVNHYLEVMGYGDMKVKMIKVQKNMFASEERELTKGEYECLIDTAVSMGNEQLALIIQTLGSTGIRISELKSVTLESVIRGVADIHNKGKLRRILYPSELRNALLRYAERHEIVQGSIFITRTGSPLNRCNIWKMLKQLSVAAGIDPSKVFPHNMRHLFARSFYNIKKDIARLADVLGHSSIETTRIYVKTSGEEHRRLLDSMKMVVKSDYIIKKVVDRKCFAKSTT